MAKVPLPGYVKTRLRSIFSDVQCSELSKCFLLDTVAKVDTKPLAIVIAFTPADCWNEIEILLSGKYLHVPQSGSDLGERLESAISEVSKKGFGPVVIIGTDSPTLPADYIESALEHLKANENGIVIGPTNDGGYYLIGLSSPHERLFRGVSWSTNRVFAQTLAKAETIPGASILELPIWYDVDEPDDLTRLIIEFEKDENTRLLAPQTFQWLASHHRC